MSANIVSNETRTQQATIPTQLFLAKNEICESSSVFSLYVLPYVRSYGNAGCVHSESVQSNVMYFGMQYTKTVGYNTSAIHVSNNIASDDNNS